jgi:2-oxoisovalerate dehydrogenase E1 component alpha subunit
MLLTRALDDRQSILARQGRQGIHLSARGHEACAAGSALAFTPGRDILVPSHRSLAAVLAWGVTPHEVLLQCLSRADDPASGGRSMPNHYGHRARNVLSMSSPIGTQLPHAVGAALASSIHQSDSAVLVFFGDGASSKADFHEALNFAAIRQLPVVFVCENNGWSISVPIERQMAVRSVADRARSYGMPGQAVDGTDPVAVFNAVTAAVQRARAGDGPSLIEALTYRHGGHSRADPGKYRPDDEVAAWKARDPIPAFRARLEAAGVEAAVLDAIDEETRAKVAEAEAEARAAPEPDPGVLETEVWSDGSSTWRN